MANSNSSFPISQVLRKMITRKNPDDALAGAAKGGLEKTLGVWDLIILGVGAIIGSGIFAVVGIAAAGSADGSSPGAGPALIISMVIAAIACVFSALCYNDTGCRRSLYIYFCNSGRICCVDCRLDFDAGIRNRFYCSCLCMDKSLFTIYKRIFEYSSGMVC